MISIHPHDLSPAQAAAAAATHGMGLVQDVINCTVTQRLNGDRSLRLQASHTEHNHGLLAADRLIYADGQFYRIIRATRSDRRGQATLAVEAQHVIYDLLESSIENIETKEDPAYIDGITAAQALSQVLAGSAFTPGTVDVDPAKLDYLDILRMDRLACLTQIMETWGGEIVPDNWTIHLLEASGADRGVQLRLMRNMEGLEIDEDISAVKTRLHIVGYEDASIESVNGGKDYLDSPNIGLYSQIREGYAHFEDEDDPTELKRLGLERLSEVDKVQLTARVDLLRLHQEAPGHYAELDYVQVGDTVTVIHDKFGTLSVRVLEREAEITRDGTVINTRLTLGNAQADQFFRGFKAAAEAAQAAKRQAAQAGQTANQARALGIQHQALINQANAAISEAEAQIEDARELLTQHGQAIEQNETDIASKASQTAVDTLQQTVTQQGTQISQNATNITSKADKTVVDALNQTVTQQGTQISQNATDIASKASQAAVDTINGTVNNHTTLISQNATDIASKASKAEVNTLTGRVSTAESNIEQTPELISAVVGALQVGGRNIVKNSDFSQGINAGWLYSGLTNRELSNATGWTWEGKSSLRIFCAPNSNGYCAQNEIVQVMESTPFIASFYARWNSTVIANYGSSRILSAQCFDADDNSLYYGQIKAEEIPYANIWQRIVLPFNAPAGTVRITVRISLYSVSTTESNYIGIQHVQLEQGNKITPWEPANEDIQDQITTLSIDLNAAEQAITTKAETTVTDGLSTRLTSTEQKTTPDAMTATVRNHANYKSDLAGKNRTYLLGTPPSGAITGDLWIDTANGNLLKRWNGSSWVAVQDGAISIAQNTANKIAWLIASGDSASNMVLTEQLYELVTQRVMITANEQIDIKIANVQPGGRNLVKNSDFSQGINAGWSYSGLTNRELSNATGWTWEGKSSLRIFCAPNSNGYCAQNEIVQVMESTPFIASFYVRWNSTVIANYGDNRILSAQCFDSDNNSLNYQHITVNNIPYTNVWQRIVLPFNAPADTVRIQVTIRLYSTSATESNYIGIQHVQLEQGNKITPWKLAEEDPSIALKAAGIEIGPGTMNLYAGLSYSELFGSGATEMGRANTRADGLGSWMGGSPANAKNRQWMNGIAQFQEIRLGNTAVNQIGRTYTYYQEGIGGDMVPFDMFFNAPADLSGIQNVRLYVQCASPAYYQPGQGMVFDTSVYNGATSKYRVQVDFDGYAGPVQTQKYDYSAATQFPASSSHPIVDSGIDITQLLNKSSGLLLRERHAITLQPVSGAIRFYVIVVVTGVGAQPASAPY